MSYTLRTSTGIRIENFSNEYSAMQEASEMMKRAGELGVTYTVEVINTERNDDVVRKFSR